MMKYIPTHATSIILRCCATPEGIEKAHGIKQRDGAYLHDDVQKAYIKMMRNGGPKTRQTENGTRDAMHTSFLEKYGIVIERRKRSEDNSSALQRLSHIESMLEELLEVWK